MRALVTGCAGFVGRHMMTELVSRGWSVLGVDIRDWPYSAEPMTKVDAREIFAGRQLAGEVYDLVVHCAYHVGGRRAIDGEPRLLALNLELDSMMFDWATRTQQRAVLYYSSSAAYPIRFQRSDGWARLDESMIDLDNVEQPDARYGWAKVTGEQLAAAARLSGLRVHVVRPFSGYGEDQDMDYPWPAIFSRVVNGDLSVWGPPGQFRDWIHIDDVVAGSIEVVERGIVEPVNLCSGIGIEMGDLAVRMSRAARVPSLAHPEYQTDMPTGVMVRIGDPTIMKRIFRPKVDLEEGIRRICRLWEG